jgi:glycosyltransferase involved in cell wall biosynthesis
MIKLYISPDYSENKTETGGIRRVVDAMVEHLPKFGIEVVHDPSQAHIINNHGAMLTTFPNVPMVNTSHGVYWSRYRWGDNYIDVNIDCIESMRQSVAHTAPSEWVAKAIRRGGLFYPEVVYHGVNTEEFKPSNENAGYIVYAKARADHVSDPTDMMNVASIMPNRQFVAIKGIQTNNVEVVGELPYAKMNKLIEEAGVYLSTARETFGIGTLEALACGVPVAGWDCGGNSEIIIPGVTGYLAPWGDYKTLAECIEKCLLERDRLSTNCVEDARTRWQWEPRIKQYADIFKRVYSTYYERFDKPRVSVIVTAYKLDAYLPQCLESISAQSYTDLECLVVDDAQLKSTETIVEAFSKKDKRIKYVPTPNNFGLAGARNFGFNQTGGLFIRHMDADDWLAPNAIELETHALENDSSLHIVYGHLETVHEDGTPYLDSHGERERSDWPPEDFNWFQQMAHLNQLPSTVMARREVYEKSGGYRERMKRNEDAEFWCRVTSLGFRAKKITQGITMYHRDRVDSKGATEWKTEGKEPDWTSWFPWRMGASEYGVGRDILRKYGNSHPHSYLVPFAAQGKPNNLRCWYVHDYAYPVVSVIVTCGPGHKGYLVDALDSVQAQTFTDWECIVVNDTGEAWPADIMGAPYAKVINMDGNQGAAKARNEGYKHARGNYIIWLDADDIWTPWMLEKMVATAEENFGVIFTDMIQCKIGDDGKEHYSIYRYPEFECQKAAFGMQYSGTSVLYPRKIVQSVFDSEGGFDTEIVGMEDKSFQTAVHANGFCAYRIPEPLFIYRLYSSSKREKDYTKIDQIKEYMDKKWFAYRTGAKIMGCGCGAKKVVTTKAQSTLTSSGNFQPESIIYSADTPGVQMVKVEYIGSLREPFSIRSRVDPSVTYRFGNNDYHRVKPVFLQDAEFLMGLLNEFGQSNYRVVTTGPALEGQDIITFLGAPLEA